MMFLFIRWLLTVGFVSSTFILYKNTKNSKKVSPALLSSVKTAGIADKERHVTLLDSSLKKLTNRGLYERMNIESFNFQLVLDDTRYVLISHGTQEDPIYNFGNQACLEVFERTWEELCATPSRESVVLRSQDEELRKILMHEVTTKGFVEGATGIRITGTGKLIRLVDAVVWNCYDENGDYYGQAAFFDREKLEGIASQV